MKFGTKHIPLLSCNIIHSLPGRIRIHCRALRFLEYEIPEIEERITNIPEVFSAKITLITGNLLVNFDDSIASEENLRENCESIISAFSRVAYKAEREHHNKTTVNERRLQEASISEMLTRVAVMTVTLGISLAFGILVLGPWNFLYFFKFLRIPIWGCARQDSNLRPLAPEAL